MLLALKLILVFLAIHLMALTDREEPHCKAFAIVPQKNQTKMYIGLGFYASATKKLFEFDATTWMNPCYLNFYASNAFLVVFLLKDRVVYCESVKPPDICFQPTFPAQYLLRVERLEKRCPNATRT